MKITTADLKAIVDVLDDIAEEADSLDKQEAVEARNALKNVSDALRRADSMLNTQLLSLLEQPYIVGNHRYVRGDKYARRFDHNRIGAMVADLVRVDHETGEVRSTQDAVAMAVHVMLALYSSRSTSVKTGELKNRLGIGDPEAEGLAVHEIIGSEVKVYELNS